MLEVRAVERALHKEHVVRIIFHQQYWKAPVHMLNGLYLKINC